MYESEAQLCDAFTLAARGSGWTVYPELGDWDMVLVRRGIQVGVQAKLTANLKVILQAFPDRAWTYGQRRHEPKVGPHYRSVLIGGFAKKANDGLRLHTEEFCAICRHLKLVVLAPPQPTDFKLWWPGGINWLRNGTAPLANAWNAYGVDWRWYRWRPRSLLWVPPIVPDLPAGVPSPQKVSPWTFASLYLEQRLRERGWVTIDDAREVSARAGGKWNMSSLLRRWCICTADRIGKQRKWVKHPRFKPASEEFPQVAKQLTQAL